VSGGEALIEVDSISYAYAPGLEPALRDVSMRIVAGEFVALVGQNGAGKTTLAKHFNGLLLPTAGSVRVGGQDTRAAGTRRLAATVGYCYQNPDHQIFSRTLRKEVAFGPTNLGLPPAQVARNVDEALRLVGLEDRADAYPFLLGRGERQRLAVASIIAMGSSILVVDEPTTGLDLQGIRSIMALLQRWNQESGRTIVVITHDINVVAQYVPRTVVMARGRIVADGPTRSALTDWAALEAADVRPPQVTRVARRLARYGISPDVLTVEELAAEIRGRLAPGAGRPESA
jgi:energy-coupling factor transporter ATP-binding protein EcfA2